MLFLVFRNLNGIKFLSMQIVHTLGDPVYVEKLKLLINDSGPLAKPQDYGLNHSLVIDGSAGILVIVTPTEAIAICSSINTK